METKIFFAFVVLIHLNLISARPKDPLAKNSTLENSNKTDTDCNEGEAFHNGTGKCYKIYTQGPCGELMRFLVDSPKSNFGYCDCDPIDLDKNNCTQRPKIFWPRENRCYYAFEQGPCLRGEWLMVDKKDFYYDPFCTRNPCLPNDNKNMSDPENMFWFPFGGLCYQTGTQGFCRESKYKVYIMKNEINPLCLAESACQIITEDAEEEIMCPAETDDSGSGSNSTRSKRFAGNCRRRHHSIQFG